MMNYREEIITEPGRIARLTTGPSHASQLSEELSGMTIIPLEKPQQGGGIFSRIKSTLFSSYESGIRFPFVASCIVRTTHALEEYHVGVKADGTSLLLKPDVNSRPQSATELCSLCLPGSFEGYSISSIYLGKSQGSLVAVTVGGGKVVLLCVKGAKMSELKTISLPVVVPMTGVFLNERNGQIELLIVLDKTHILVLPDITKPADYQFVFTKSLREQIKMGEFSSITDEAMATAFDHRPKGTGNEENPTLSSVLIGTTFNNIVTLNDFKAIYLHEKAMDLLLLRHPGTAVHALVRSESIHRIKSSMAQYHQTPKEIIVKEVGTLERCLNLNCPDYSISELHFIDSSVIIYFSENNRTVSEIIPIASQTEKYVNTFLSAPSVFSFIHQRLSRDSVLTLFSGSQEWINIFTCCSVGESMGSGFLDSVSCMLGDKKWESIVKEKLEALPIEVRDHFASCLKLLPNLKPHQRAGKIAALVDQELLAAPTGDMAHRIRTLLRLLKYYCVYSVFGSTATRSDLVLILKKLVVINHIFSHYCVSVDTTAFANISDFIGKVELVFLASPSVEVGFLSATTDIALHAGFRRYHIARSLATSSSVSDRETAIAKFKDVEDEMALYSQYIVPQESIEKSLGKQSATFVYWYSVSLLFQNDYKFEIDLLSRLHALATGKKESILEAMVGKAIANGDWTRVKQLLAQVPKANASYKQQVVRLMCTEARIRNELPQVFELVKENKETIALIISEIQSEISNRSDYLEKQTMFMQLFSLSCYVGDFSTGVTSMVNWYSDLLCPFTSTEPGEFTDIPFDFVEIEARLTLQLRALVLARSVFSKITVDVRRKIKFSPSFIKEKIILVEALIAFYSFSADEDAAHRILDVTTGCIDPTLLCRNLSALGLIVISVALANAAKLEIFRASLAPYIELLLKCEDDAKYLPPCRWDPTETYDAKLPLIPQITPSMAFVRSDASGPIGTAGNQVRAMHRAMETVLRRTKSKNDIVDSIEYIYLVKNRSTVPNFLIDLLEAHTVGGWIDLLKLYMRKENYRECVRLIETHVKYWRPTPSDPLGSGMMLNVPLLAQLQRALELVVLETEDDELQFLLKQLNVALDELKETLREISQRFVM